MFANTYLTAAAVLTFASGAYGQSPVNFASIPGISSPPAVQVDLSQAMLAFVAAAASQTDPATAEALKGITGVRVYVYNNLSNADAVTTFIDNSSQRLEGEGWTRTVVVQEGESKVRMYTQVTDAVLSGLTLMVLEGNREAVFIDVAGTIDPTQLGRLIAHFGMSGMIDGMMQQGINGAPGSGPAAAAPGQPASPATANGAAAPR